MGKAPLPLSSSIRTIASDKLLRTISIPKMKRKLIELFLDNTKNDSPINLLDNENGVKKTLRFIHCRQLNDERTVAFNQSWKQESDVFDEKRQIWIDRFIDTEKDDLFIPRDDAQ